MKHMESHASRAEALAPLPYHREVVEFLKTQEPDVWRWASSQKAKEEHAQELRDRLLRDTYRLDSTGHPEVHAALTTAMQRLGIRIPATLYQSGGSEMNAALLHLPGEVHILLQGPVLERLTADELLALFGHELAHHLIWERDNGDFLVADRILQDAMAATNAGNSHRETLRRYALHTELFADRGGAVAAGGIEAAVTTLVKVRTGIGSVDAAAYLRQAAEVDAADQTASAALSHPETFIRARALALWWNDADNLEPWLATRLQGTLALERLDLPGQLRLQGMTRGFLAHFMADPALHSDAMLNQVRSMFSDWTVSEPAVPPSAFGQDAVDDSVRGLLNALMVDLALADPELQELALVRAARMARELGSLEALHANLRRDAGFGKREFDRLGRLVAKEAQA